MKIPVATTLKNRASNTDKDARLLNAFVEIKGDPKKGGIKRVVKRPSLIATFSALESGAGNGQGLFVFSTPSTTGVGDSEGNQTLVGIQNDVLNNAPTPVVTRLEFTTQPSDFIINAAMSPAVVVAARDSFGNTITSYTGTVTIALYSNLCGGTLSGTLSVAAVAGVATFSNLLIDTVCDGYSLIATASGLRSAISIGTFKIIDTYELTITGNTSDYNVYTAFVAKYGTPPASPTLSVTINSGVIVSASSTSAAALTWDTSWTGTPVFTFINNGYVIGKGGAGAQGGYRPGPLGAGGTGGNGGKAMELSGKTVSITNASGSIWGGGGGAGGGGAAACGGGNGTASVGAGGGGGGAGGGAGGAAGADNGTTGDGSITSSPTAGTSESGSLITQTGGIGGTGGTGTAVIDGSTATGGYGGAGGAYGTAGSSGEGGSFTGLGVTFDGGSGGSAGKAINLTGGTANFVSGSGSPNVKGAVS